MGADDLNEEKMDELLRLMRAAVPDTSGMSDAGKVGFVYKFDYDPSASYEKLDVVKFGMSLWTPKGDTTGNPPPDQSQEGQENVEENEHWVLFLPGALGSEYVKKTDLAKAPTETTAGKAGISYPDGKTIFSDENGMLTGATAGKELTQEELEEQIANGDLEAGDVVYLTGKPAGTNGLLIVVDKELNEDSVHAIRNSAVAKAINAANALIAENQRLIAETQALRATLEGFGLGKICPVDVTDVTEANGMVLGAFEKNASMDGTLANKINKVSSSLGVIKNLHVINGVSVANSMSAISTYLTLEPGTYLFIGKIAKECNMGIILENRNLVYLMANSRFFVTGISFSSQTNIAFSAESQNGFALTDDINLNLLQIVKMK